MLSRERVTFVFLYFLVYLVLKPNLLNEGVESEILFVTNKDTAASLKAKYPDTAFLGRVNPMDYPSLSLNDYVKMLNELKKDGLLLGPDAEHMDRLGSKYILYELKDTGMGVHGTVLHTYDDLKKNQGEIDKILPKGGPPRVLKMLRGSTGLGVWKLENKGDHILMTDAYTQTSKEIARNDVIPEFLALCQEDAISMPFLPLIKDGEFRFLLSKHQVNIHLFFTSLILHKLIIIHHSLQASKILSIFRFWRWCTRSQLMNRLSQLL